MSDPTRTQQPPATGADAESRANDATLPRTAGAPVPGLALGPPAHEGELGTLGRYRVLQQLGAGGMGAVYLGYHTGLQCKVALKVMLADAAADSAARDRFLREARTAAQVKSDHVVTIHDVDEANGVPFIAMEYLLGAPLDAYLKKKGELPLGQAVRIARECALGLAAVHSQGLIHRDIKPGNLWLEAPHGRAKLLDFGLARSESDEHHITSTGGVVGTVAYMSPQQGRGENVDARTDLWSLGVVLYRLCTGRMPFEGVSQMAVLTSIAIDAPLAPRAMNPQMPPALEALILKLLAKDPAARYQTAQEVADALSAVERGDVPAVVAVRIPQSLAVSAQTQNVWESIADDSQSIAVPLADPSEATESSDVAPPWRASKVPLLLGASALTAALAGLVAVLVWLNKPGDGAKEPYPPILHAPAKGRLAILDAPAGTEFALKRDGVVVVPKTGSRSIQLEPGRYTLEFASPVAPGTKFVPDVIEVVAGGSVRVSVREEKVDGNPPAPGPKVYPLPTDLLAPMTPLKPEKVFTLDHLDPAKHVPAEERYEWHPKELVALLGSHRQRTPGPLKWVRTSPDGTFALAGDGHGTSWRVDLKTGRVTDGPPVVVMSEDFRRGAHGHKVYDSTDPKAAPVEYLGVGEIRAFLTDDLVLAVKDNVFALRKLDGKGGADVLASYEGALHFALSPDRKYLALVFADETCRVYDVLPTGVKEKFETLPGTEGRTLSYAPTFSYTGLMSTTGRDGERSIGRVWDVSRAPPVLVSSGPRGTLTGDGKYLFGFGNESFDVYAVGKDAKPLTSGQLQGVGGFFAGVSSSRDGATVVTTQLDGAVRVWEIKLGVLNERNPIRAQPLLYWKYADVSPDGRFLVANASGARTDLYDLNDLSARALLGTQMRVRFSWDGGALGLGGEVRRAPAFGAGSALPTGWTVRCFSPDGKWVVATNESELGVWDASTPGTEPLWKVKSVSLHALDFTPNGRFLIGRSTPVPHPTKVRVWAMTVRGPQLHFETDFLEPIFADALAPDGSTLVATVHNRGLWAYPLVNGVPGPPRVLDSHPLFRGCDVSSDGRTVLAFDTTLKFFSLATGKAVHEIATRGRPLGARFHPDGKHVLVTNFDGTTYVLRLPKEALAALGDTDRSAIDPTKK